MPSLFVTIPQGPCVRDFLVLGTLDQLTKALPGFDVVVLTPAWGVREFREMVPGAVQVERSETPTSAGANERLVRLRRRMRRKTAVNAIVRAETARFRAPAYLDELFDRFQPRAVISTHPLPSHDYNVVTAARQRKILTLGVVKSWDNIGKGLSARPSLLSVWSPTNKSEAIDLAGYDPEQVFVNGAVSFDPYYDPTWRDSREEFFNVLKLDSSRPLITYATSGVYDVKYFGRDETFLVDELLEAVHSSPHLRDCQLVVRLHPSSRLEDFQRFQSADDVRFSFASYMPALGWYTSAADVREQTNLLAHSDVIVTPGSSWAVEAAVFDTPTVCPMYSTIQPEHAAAQFDGVTLAGHFRPLAANGWVPIPRSYIELRASIESALGNRGAYAEGRKAIVDAYVFHRDGRSRDRLVDWIAQVVRDAPERR